MSARKRTNKRPKGCGYDYWSRRLGNDGNQGYGPEVKRLTHRLERIESKKIAREEMLNEELPDKDVFFFVCSSCGQLSLERDRSRTLGTTTECVYC